MNKAKRTKNNEPVKVNAQLEEIKNLDYNIQVSRAMYVLDQMIRKLKLMTNLSFFVANDGDYLKEFMSQDKINFILAVANNNNYFAQPDINSSSSIERVLSKINLFQAENTKEKVCLKEKKNFILGSMEGRKDPYTSQMVDLIYGNERLRKNLKQVHHDMEDPDLVEFTTAMENFNVVAARRLATSGDEYVLHHQRGKAAYKSNIVLKKLINEMQEQLDMQREELGKKLQGKQEILKKYREKMEIVKLDFQYRLKEIVYNSEEEMMISSMANEEKLINLSEEAKEATTNYQNYLNEHVTEEKLLRSKRFKIVTQLTNWVAMYDTDMGEKQLEYDILKKQFDDANDLMEKLHDDFEVQDKEYVVLMQEKIDEDERIYNEMAYIFLLNRAARRIQRWWRAYKARKLARRKKKGKGKDGGKKKKGKAPPEKHVLKKEKPNVTRVGDANVALDKKFAGEIFSDIKDPDAFAKKDVTVEL